MIIEDLRQSWDESPPFGLFRPLYPSVDFVKDWLVLGDGTPLARRSCDERGAPALVFKGGEERVMTLLALAYLRPMTARILDHMRRAAREWGRGEKCLAHIHLAFGGLSRLDEPEEAAFRLFMADGLMKAGVPTCDLLKAFDLDRAPDDLLEKFNVDELRVPKGNGRPSGQWAKGGEGDASAQSTPAQFLPPILAEPPILPPLLAEPPVTPPLAEWPTDPTVPPGEGWVWKGSSDSQPGDRYGSWHDEENEQSLYPDFNHPSPIEPHWDLDRTRWIQVSMVSEWDIAA